MEALCPRLQSRDGCADGPARARSACGAFAWRQLVGRLLLRKRSGLPPIRASESCSGPRRERRLRDVATLGPVIADGHDSVPHADRPAAYIPLANAPLEREEHAMTAHLLIIYPAPKDVAKFDRA